MIVRTMLPQEIDVTINLVNYYTDEAAQAIPGLAEQYDTNSIINTVRKYSISPNYVWFNLYEGQRPVGFIAGYLGQQPWNENLFLGHISLIYVLPSHRSLPVFRQLIDKFTEWAKENNCVKITAGDIGIDEERTRAIYEHIGFKPLLLMAKEITE